MNTTVIRKYLGATSGRLQPSLIRSINNTDTKIPFTTLVDESISKGIRLNFQGSFNRGPFLFALNTEYTTF